MALNVVSRIKAITRGKPQAAPAARHRNGRPKRPDLPRYLTQDELGRFRRAVLASGSVRDVALFALMYYYGLRAVEVTMLLLEDVDLSRRRVRIRRAKSGESHEYLLPPNLVAHLRRYLKKRIERGPFLFTGRESTNQHGLRVLQVQRLFKEYARDAGLPHSVASHSLRHSIAVHALEEGFGLEYVAELLGHTSVKSTAIYAKVTTPARDAMIQRLAVSRHVVAW